MGCLSLELIQLWDPRTRSHWTAWAVGRWFPLKSSASGNARVRASLWCGYAPVRASGLVFVRPWSSSLSPLALCHSHCLWCLGPAPFTEELVIAHV